MIKTTYETDKSIKEYVQQAKKRKKDKDTGFCVWVVHITRQESFVR